MNGSQAVENKYKIEKQNFKVKPDKELHNSATKKIGDRTHFVANIIDQEDLKRSHIPFASIKSKIGNDQKMRNEFSPSKTSYKTFQEVKMDFAAHKDMSVTSRLPFSQIMRKPIEVKISSQNPDHTYNKTNFTWKSPTVMQ